MSLGQAVERTPIEIIEDIISALPAKNQTRRGEYNLYRVCGWLATYITTESKQ